MGNFEKGGDASINNRKDNIVRRLSPSVKCVTPLFRAIWPKPKCELQKGARAPSASPPVAPLIRIEKID